MTLSQLRLSGCSYSPQVTNKQAEEAENRQGDADVVFRPLFWRLKQDTVLSLSLNENWVTACQSRWRERKTTLQLLISFPSEYKLREKKQKTNLRRSAAMLVFFPPFVNPHTFHPSLVSPSVRRFPRLFALHYVALTLFRLFLSPSGSLLASFESLFLSSASCKTTCAASSCLVCRVTL